MTRVPNVLAIAGSDPSGGAGIQADLKAIAANGGYGMAAITALTAQNTRGVTGVHVPPAAFLRDQLEALSADVRIDAVKLGMLANAEVIEVVHAWLDRLHTAHAELGAPRTPVVLDPVMIATSGDRLLAPEAVAALRRLMTRVDVVTPNLPELAALIGEPPARTWAEALEQGQRLAMNSSEYDAAAAPAPHGLLVLVKGGHLADADAPAPMPGDASAPGTSPTPSGLAPRRADCPDALVGRDGVVLNLPGERVNTHNTHGTGCSLSSALATWAARTNHAERDSAFPGAADEAGGSHPSPDLGEAPSTPDWPRALRETKSWLTQAMRDADRLEVGRSGAGHGPVHHLGALWDRAGV